MLDDGSPEDRVFSPRFVMRSNSNPSTTSTSQSPTPMPMTSESSNNSKSAAIGAGAGMGVLVLIGVLAALYVIWKKRAGKGEELGGGDGERERDRELIVRKPRAERGRRESERSEGNRVDCYS